MVETQISSNYNRLKGASWFNNLYKREILLIGCGGISSWTALLLGRLGVDLYIYDFDLVEQHNLGGQLFKNSDVRKTKVAAISNTLREFCDSDIEVEIFEEKYLKDSPSSDIVITGVDNMDARKNSFNNWINHLNNSIAENPNYNLDECLYIDGRLNLEKLQIFCIKGTDTKAQERYAKDFLFDDSEVAEMDCTARQTSFMASMIASHMIGFLCNFFGEDFRDVPFYYEYVLPLNMTNNEPD